MFVHRAYLEQCISKGMSLQAIGLEAGCHPTTVALWLRKYGLKATHSDRFAPKGGLERARLADLVDQGLSLREIAERLDRSISTVVKWLKRYGLRRSGRSSGLYRTASDLTGLSASARGTD